MLVSAAIDEFLKHLAITKSENTVSSYGNGLSHLARMAGERDVSTLSAEIVPEFVTWLHENREVGQKSLNLYLVALSRFYSWCVLRGLAEQDTLRFEDWVAQYRRQTKRRAPKTPPEEDVQKLLAFMHGSEPKPWKPGTESALLMNLRWLRDIALVETLRCTGCRIDEALGLSVGNVKDRYAIITGKGNKERQIMWDERGWQALSAYLELRNPGPDDPLFVSHEWRGSTRLTANGARDIIGSWCRYAGIKEITPHQFRHRFATILLRETGNLAQVQDLMGHESPLTTRIYTQFSEEDLKRVHDSVSL